MKRSAPFFILQVNQVGVLFQHNFYGSVSEVREIQLYIIFARAWDTNIKMYAVNPMAQARCIGESCLLFSRPGLAPANTSG